MPRNRKLECTSLVSERQIVKPLKIVAVNNCSLTVLDELVQFLSTLEAKHEDLDWKLSHLFRLHCTSTSRFRVAQKGTAGLPSVYLLAKLRLVTCVLSGIAKQQ